MEILRKTLSEIIDLYDFFQKDSIKTTTKLSNEAMKKLLMKWIDFEINEMTSELIHSEILESARSRCSIAYTNKLRSYLNKLFSWASKMNYIQNNPIANIPVFKTPDDRRKNAIYFTPKDWRQFEAVAYSKYSIDGDNYKYYIIFNVLYYMGIRLGELLALSLDDVRDGYMEINKTCSYCPKRIKIDGYIVTPPKTKNSYRRIKMPNILNAEIMIYIRKYLDTNKKNDPFLFGGKKPIQQKTIRKKFKEITELAELPIMKLHNLRHSHASFLINRGAVPKAVAERLGNTEGEVLKTYSHLFDSSSDACIAIINAEYKDVQSLRNRPF